MTLLWHCLALTVTVLYVQPAASAFVTLGVFSQCVTDETDCVTNSLTIGQYPVCSDCTMFVKCNGAGSAAVSCPSGLNYDYIAGVCDFQGQATCVTSATSATSMTSETSETSPTSPTSPTSQTSQTSPTTIPTLGVFTSCLASEADCVTNSLAIGQYPVCSDCSVFVKCNGAGSSTITCGAGTEYDVNLGVCNHIGLAVCGTSP